MTALQIFALVDAAFTVRERALAIYDQAVKDGIITIEEQADQKERIEKLRNS